MKRRTAAREFAVVVQDLAEAIAALTAAAESGHKLAIWSAPGAAASVGSGWFAAVERRARAAVPQASARFILDCADRADLAQEAWREGVAEVCFTGRATVALRLADIAAARRAKLHRRRPRGLDKSKAHESRAQHNERRVRG